jgi:hypothetical protein
LCEQLLGKVTATRQPDTAAVKTVYLASDDTKIRKEAVAVSAAAAVRFLENPPAPPRTIGEWFDQSCCWHNKAWRK